MYLADYHTHCAWSMDAKVPMARMALAAAEKGFDEICFTDHVEPFESGSWEHNVYDFAALDREYEEARAAVGDRILIRRGVELGEGCSVGSMSLVNRSAEPWGVYVGIPARRVKERSRKLLEYCAEFESQL